MNRFFVSSSQIIGKEVIIADTAQQHHIRDVLRLKKGAKAEIADSSGREYLAEISELSKTAVKFAVIRILSAKEPSGARLTVACAIPKNAKFEDIIDKLTQLGVERIIPMLTERVVVKLDGKKKASRLERYRRIAVSASQQSKRNKIPIIDPVTDFSAVLSKAKDYDLRLIPHLEGNRKPLTEVLSFSIPIPLPVPMHIFMLIGPEGDFSETEVKSAKNAGFIPVSLGDLILRVDTAAIAAVAIIKHCLTL